METVTAQPTIRCGPDTDRYLESEGAIAQALDNSSIRISSKLLKLSPARQQLILLHELAHLHQLAAPGNDPVRALEAEAWDAAYAWIEGRSFTIRGKANSPLNAMAIIQGGKEGHPHAPIWYSRSPIEPIGDKSTITVKKVAIHEAITLETVLDQMLAAKGETEFVVVCHGSGAGLKLHLQRGSTAGAEKDVIFQLASDRPGKELAIDGSTSVTPTKTDEDLATLTRLSQTQVAALRAKMNQVRNLQLKHVAFRACNMGISPDTMEAFQKFFGAASVSAPVAFDSYGRFAPVIGVNVEAWAKAKRKSGFHVSIDGGVAAGTRDAGSALVYNILAASHTKEEFRAWVKNHIVDGGWGSTGVIYHGVKVLHTLSVNAPSVYFVRDQEFIDGLVNLKAK